jgi:thiamine-phosphate pyrophosphorylase
LFPRLHIVTDSLDVVRGAVGHGPVAIQVRVKTSDRQAYALTVAAREICEDARLTRVDDRFDTLLLVDDRVGVALAAGADGVHVGADDLPVAAARRVLGPTAIVGATCRTPAGARAAADDGASYLGVGPAFPTTSKTELPAPIGPPGIAADRVKLLDAYGVAAISAITRDPAGATIEFLKALGDAA